MLIQKCTLLEVGFRVKEVDRCLQKLILGIEVFLFDKWPCRMMEIVAWVAGVDHKDSSMLVTREFSLTS